MKLEDVRSVTVVGAGIMGHGIAQTMAMAGYDVVLNDVSADALTAGMARARSNLNLFEANGFLTADEAAAAYKRIVPEVDLEKAVANADVVFEAVKEDVDVKRGLFNRLDAICPDRTILASNTSALLLGEFSSGVARQDRVLIAHWWNPPHIVPTVEVVRGAKTSDETFTLVYDLLKKAKKMPVRVNKEIPGHLGNRVQLAMLRECWYMWQAGVASAEDIDICVKGSLGFRLASIGPLITNDLGGNDTICAVGQYLLPFLSGAPEPPEAYVKMVEDGNYGYKTGKGFYDYTPEEWKEVIAKRDSEFLQRLKTLYW